VSANLVRATLDSAFLLALSVWVGSLLFVSLGVLVPLLRGGSDSGSTLPMARAWLSRLYLWGTTCGAIALPASLGAPLSFPGEFRSPWVALEAVLLIGGTLAMLHGSNSLVPGLDRARRAGPEAAPEASRVLARCIRLNLAVAALGSLLLVAFAFRPPPRTAGIIEPTPQERTRRALEAAARGPTVGGSPPANPPAEARDPGH
jgi:hypothetical protein